jgi:hypothetical protein
VKSRLQRLFTECHWIFIKDISPDNFNKWRARQTFSPKTANEYLGHANALFNWMERNESLERNPLKIVGKSETRGKERYVRRALAVIWIFMRCDTHLQRCWRVRVFRRVWRWN